MNYLQKKKQALLNYVQSGGRLPSEYQEVDYLESEQSGYQYFEIRNSATNGDKVYIKVQHLGGTNEGGFFGINIFSELYFKNNQILHWNEILLDNPPHTTVVGNDIVELQAHYSSGTNSIERLFTYRTDRYKFYGRIWYCRITDINDTPIRDLVPCYRKSDNEVGMYDLISDTFFTNQGTGQFTYGSEV